MLFSKMFLIRCKTSLLFSKNLRNSNNILKAPSRHKKFFHQTTFELFTVKATYSFFILAKNPLLLNNIAKAVLLFKKINVCFLHIGSNTLNRIKISICFNIKLNLLPKVIPY